MRPPTEAPVSGALVALANGLNRDPFAVLGPHPDEGGRGIIVRAFYPAARAIDLRLVATGELVPMARRQPAGLFDVVVESRSSRELADPRTLDYRLRLTFPGDHVIEIDDPYRYGR